MPSAARPTIPDWIRCTKRADGDKLIRCTLTGTLYHAEAVSLSSALREYPGIGVKLTSEQFSHTGLCAASTGRWVTAAAEISDEVKLGTRERLERYLKERDIKLIDIPKALVLYEVTSLGVMVAFWAGCFLVQPTQRGMVLTAVARAKGQNVARGSTSLFAKRLATSYAEGFVARAALKPFIIPTKLYLTWRLQQAASALGSALRTVRGAAAGSDRR